MSHPLKKGDQITLVTYTLPSIGHPFKSEIRVTPHRVVTKAGKVSYSVDTRMGERRFKQADIGKPFEGHFRGSRIIAVTPDMDVDEAIEKAKKAIIDALSAKIRTYRELIDSHQSALDSDIPVTIRQNND